MVDYEKSKHLSLVLKAASDGTRRTMLTTLVQQGSSRVTDIAKHFDMSLNAVSKHIKVLENAGLIKRRTLGREHFIEVDLEPLHNVDDWFKQLRSIWDLRLDALDELLTNNIQTGEENND